MNKIEKTRNYLKSINEPSSSTFLILLICGDFAFISLHCIAIFLSDLKHPMLNISLDNGYPEMYQYIKFLWITVLLIYISIKNKSFHYVSWALVFTYFLLDDSLKIHEYVGGLIAGHLNFIPPFGLRLQDWGELIVSGSVFILLLPILIWAYRNGPPMFKKVSQDITLLILVLVFFGIFVDMAAIALPNKTGWDVRILLELIEDGGEMLATSLILWYLFLLNLRNNFDGSYLCDLMHIVLKRSCN